jgi:hypothetical protein
MSRILAPPSLHKFPCCDSLATNTKGFLRAVPWQVVFKGRILQRYCDVK